MEQSNIPINERDNAKGEIASDEPIAEALSESEPATVILDSLSMAGPQGEYDGSKNINEIPSKTIVSKPIARMSVANTLGLNSGDSFETCFSRQFVAIKLLGHGTFGRVIQAREVATNLEYAVKVIAKKNLRGQQLDRVRGEAIILSQLQKHENIVKFNRVFESETRLFIVMELLSGGTLRTLMNARLKSTPPSWFTEAEAATIMRSIISGVCYFHSKSIVHRDLKPENILIRDQNDLTSIKIADFGLSAASEANRSISLTQQCGTLIYMAPEFFAHRTYSKPIDIWSCAMIMYQLLNNGKHPLYDSRIDNPESFRSKMKSTPTITFPSEFPHQAQNLIQKMTLLDSSSRYSANQVALHPWVTQKPDSEVPLTMFEMLSSVKTQESLLTVSKTLLFLNFIRLKCSNDKGEYLIRRGSEIYNQKLLAFSLSKNRSISGAVTKIDTSSDISPITATSALTLDSTSNNHIANNNQNPDPITASSTSSTNGEDSNSPFSEHATSFLMYQQQQQQQLLLLQQEQPSSSPQAFHTILNPSNEEDEANSTISSSPHKQLSTQSASPPLKRRPYKKHNSFTLQRGQLNIFSEFVSPGLQSKQANSSNHRYISSSNYNPQQATQTEQSPLANHSTNTSESYSPVIIQRERSDFNKRRIDSISKAVKAQPNFAMQQMN